MSWGVHKLSSPEGSLGAPRAGVGERGGVRPILFELTDQAGLVGKATRGPETLSRAPVRPGLAQVPGHLEVAGVRGCCLREDVGSGTSSWLGIKTGVGPSSVGLKLTQFEGTTNTKLGTRLWRGARQARDPEASASLS